MTELIAVRHAEARTAGLIGGPRTCTGLSDVGRQQARLLADRLHRQLNHTRVTLYTSPRPRAAETTAVVAGRLGIPPVTVDDLRDPDCGIDADGRTWQDMLAEAKAAGRIYDASIPLSDGGEPWATFLARINPMLQDIAGRHPHDTAILVGHASTVRAVHQILVGLPLDRWPTAHLEVANASMTTWTFTSERWTLICHNDHHHLDEQPHPADHRHLNGQRQQAPQQRHRPRRGQEW